MYMDRKTPVAVCHSNPLTSEDRPASHGYKRCPVCGREIKAQGFGGHMWGVHGIKVGRKAELADLQQRIEKYETYLSKVMFWDGESIGLPGYQFLVVPISSKQQTKQGMK
jgi:hypothetical protein